MIRIGIADDHTIMRSGIVANLPKDVHCVFQAATLDELMASYQKETPDVCVVDLGLGNLPGTTVINHILTRYPDW